MNNKDTKLTVSTEVLEKATELAAKEVDGVVDLAKKKIDLKSAVKKGTPFKGVTVETENGTLSLNVYVCLQQGVKVQKVAEAVQRNVKERVQAMTGIAVSQVNVIIADLELPGKSVGKIEVEK